MANYGGDLSKLVDALLGDLNKAIDGARGKGETLGEALVEGTVKGIASAKTDIADALIDEKAIRRRIKDLQKSSENAARQMKRTIEKGMSPDYGANIARYDGTIRRNARDIEALTNQLREQGIVVRNNTKAYKDLQAALEDIGYVEKKQKSSAPRKNAASEVKKQTDAEKEHIKTVKETADAAADQAKAAQKTKQAHDDAANAAKERAKVEQQVVDVSAAQSKMANVAAAQTQKLTDATNKQAKALKAANTAMREQLNMESVIRRYNKLMSDIGYPESMISKENGNAGYTIRDMVDRANMHLQTYYEGGHVNSFEEFTTGYDGRRDSKLVANWKSHTNKLKRFINTYAPYADKMNAIELPEPVSPNKSAIQAETDALNENTAAVEKNIKAKQKLAKTDVGYHAGAIARLNKAETNGRFYGSRRDTGYYGTGYYFVDAAHKNELTLGSYRNLPYTSVDISQYGNLFKADTDQKAGQLHQFLQDLTRYTQDNELNDVNTLFDDFKNIFGETVLSQEEFAAKLHELTNFMQQSSLDDRSDSVSTQFMKSLGYGGIDTRGTNYADTRYGIVLYDLQEAAVLQANITDEIQKQGDMLEKINYAPGDVFDKNEDARIQGLFDAAAQRKAVFAEFERLYDGAAFEKLQDDLDEVNQQLKNTDKLLDLWNERINNPDKVLQEYKEDDDLSMLLGDDEEELAQIVEAGREQLVELEEQRVSLLQQQANIQAAMDAERPKIDAAWEQAKLNVAAAAADNAERQAQAEESIAKSAQETAKAKLTAIQRQAYNYRRSTDNSAALAEREGVLAGQLGEIESIRNEFPALEKACASAEKAVTKTLDGIREKMQETGLSNVAEEAKTNAMSTSQMLDAIADSIEEERKNVEAAADALSAARKGIGQAYSGVVYHGSKKPLDNITFDPNSGDGFRNLGTGMYYTPELLMASEYGKNIVQTTVDLKNCFMLIKDSITSIDDLYAAMGREVPKNPDWDTVTADLGAYLTSIANVTNFSKRMQQMGYDGIFSRGYGFGSDDEHSEQLVVYDEKYWSGLTTVPYEEMQVAAVAAAEAQNKLAQATADVAAAADRAAQQVSEHADATQQEAAIKLTASEYQAALGGDAFDKLLRDFNVSERDASDLTRIAADAVRAQKMMIEGALSDNSELLRAGSQLFNESVQRASDELMRLGSTADGTDTALQDFYKYIGNTKIRYTDKDKAEFGGKEEWKAVRNSVRGMLTTSYRAPSADMLWEEILGLFPGMFDPNIVNESDQLKQIIDMTVRAKEAKKNNWKKILPIYGTTEEVQGAVASAFVDMGNALAQVNQEQAKLADGQQELAHATRQTTDELDRQNEKRREAVEAQEIIERTIAEAIAQLRTAGDNETTLFSLKDVQTGDDLVGRARDFVENIAAQSNLKLGKFTVKDDLIQAQLYNDELKVAVNQTYRLQQATEETDAALELIGQSFSQNVKALNANNFDVEGIRARAAASVEKLKSSLHGLEYDTSGLEDAAKNIASQSDFTKFNNQLKAAQDQIQAIKNSTVSKNTMNQLANMQRDMQNANIELDTMKLKLQKLGDVEGAEDATKAIERMTEAVAAYNQAQGAEAQQKAYNDYSTARSEFRARLENLNAKKSVSASASKADDSSSVDQYYEKILSTLKEINKLDTDITSLQLKDGGSGVFSGLIQQLEQQRSVLMSRAESIAGEISSAFADGFVFSENKIKRPDLSVFDDFANVNVPNTILDFFNDVNVQATLGTEKIAQFLGALNSSSKIKLDFKSKILPQLQKFIEMAYQLDQLFQEGAIGGNNKTYADITQRTTSLAAFMQQQTSAYGDDYSKWDKEVIGYIQAETKALLERGDALAKVAQAEQKYFSGMKKATSGETYDSTTPPQSTGLMQGGNAIKTEKQQLEDWINSFGKGKAVITDFTKTADGINKINFTIFDEATNSFHTFTAAMGSASDNIHYTETSMKNLTAGTAAATKVMQSLQETMDRLGALKSAGFNVDGYINQLSAKAVELRNQMQSVGDSTDVGEQTGLKNKAAEIQKMLRDLAKLEEQWRKTQQGIDEGTSRNLGTIDQNGKVDEQMYAKIRDAANGATIANQKFDSTTNTLTYTLTDADGKVTQMTASLDALTGTVNIQAGKVSHLRTAWGDIGAGLGGIAKEAARYAVNLFQVMDIVRYMRTGFNEVLEIDTALTELKKVTNETEATYNKFLQTMSKTGAVVGSTVKDLTTSASDWARLGYSIEEAGKLAENTMVLMNVSEFDNVSDATDTLISAIQAFKDEDMNVEDFSMDIIDVFNQIGNSYAISTSDLADSLTRSSASLVAANNSLEQAVALTTAANTIVQNPETVGTTLKTLSMRIRGVKTELEEAGEDTEGMITNTSKLQAQVKALTNVDGKGGINILTNAGEFKSTYDILLEISKVWDQMGDMDQAALLEIIAGKRAGSVVSGILQNGDILENAYKDALGADGSAMNELNTYLDSIQGKIDQFNNSTQTMWMNFMNADIVKFFVDLATSIVKAVDDIGLLQVAVAAFFAKTAFNADSFGQLFKIDINDVTGQIEHFGFSLKGAAKNAQGLSIATKAAAVGTQLLNAAISMGLSLAASWAIGLIIDWFDKINVTAKELKETVQELTDTYKTAKAEFSDNLGTLTISSDTNKYETLLDEFEELAKGVNAYGENISLTSDEYERYKSICEDIIGVNPSIAEGYDSATKAIGNNAGALKQLIELQKEQARLASAEYVSYGSYSTNGNFENIAQNAINEFNKALTNTSEYFIGEKSIVDNLYDLIWPDYFEITDYGIAETSADDFAQFIMRAIGYDPDRISEIIASYSSDELGFELDLWASDYTSEIVKNREKIAKELENMDADYLAGETFQSQKAFIEKVLQEHKYTKKQISNVMQEYYTDDGTFDFDAFKLGMFDVENNVTYGDILATYAGNNAEAALDVWSELADGYEVVDKKLQVAQRGMIDTFLQVPYALREYDELSISEQSFITDWIKNSQMFKIDDSTTQDEINAAKQTIINMVRAISGEDYKAAIKDKNGNIINVGLDVVLDTMANIDTSGGTYAGYKKAIEENLNALWLAIEKDAAKFGFANKRDLAIQLGYEFAFEEEVQNDNTDMFVARIAELTGESEKAVREYMDGLPPIKVTRAIEYYLAGNYDSVQGNTDDNKFTVGDAFNLPSPVSQSIDINAVQTYAALSEAASKYNDIITQTNEITADKMEVTQEYKDSLSDLGFTEEELAECFDETNELVVKNSQRLRELTKEKKKAAAADVKLAKSQSRLEYYDLVDQLDATLSSAGELNEANESVIQSLLSQIKTVEQAIYQYQLLEDSLLGTTNAFEEFAKAKEIDALNTYGDSYVEMVQTMYDGIYKTGEVGTEAFWSVVEHLVPDDEYQHFTEDADRMSAIIDYFNKNIAPTLTLKDDAFSMDFDAIENFVEDALKVGVFTGNTEKFNLVEGMDLEGAAKALKMTTAQAYAFFAALDKYNVSGNEHSFLSQLDQSTEGKIMRATAELENLNKQKLALMKDGVTDEEQTQLQTINDKITATKNSLAELGEQATNTWQEYSRIDSTLSALDEVENKATKLTEQEAIELGVEWKDGMTVQDAITQLEIQKAQLEQPTVLTAQLAQEQIKSELSELETLLGTERYVTIKGELEQDENGQWVIKATSELSDADRKYAQQIAALMNADQDLTQFLQTGMTVSETYLSSIDGTLKSILTTIGGEPAGEQQNDTNTGDNETYGPPRAGDPIHPAELIPGTAEFYAAMHRMFQHGDLNIPESEDGQYGPMYIDPSTTPGGAGQTTDTKDEPDHVTSEWESKVSDLNAQLTSAQEKVGQLETSIETLKVEKTTLESAMVTTKAETDATIARLTAEKTAADTTISTLTAEITTLETTIKTAQAEADTTIAQLTSEKSSLETSLVTVKAEYEAEIAKLSSDMETALANAQAESDATVAKVTAELEASLAAAKSEYEATVAKLSAEKTALEGSVATLTASKAEADAAIEQLNADKAALAASIASANASILQLETEKAELNAVIAESEANIATLKADKADAESNLAQSKEMLAQTQTMLAEAQSALDAANSDLTTANNLINSLTATNQNLESQVANLNTQLNDANAALSNAQTEKSAADATIAKLESALEEAQATIEALSVSSDSTSNETGTRSSTEQEPTGIDDSWLTIDMSGEPILAEGITAEVDVDTESAEDKVEELGEKVDAVLPPPDPLLLNYENLNIDTLKNILDQLDVNYKDTIGILFDGKRELEINVPDLVSLLQSQGWTTEAIVAYLQKLSAIDFGKYLITFSEGFPPIPWKDVPDEKQTDYQVSGDGESEVSDIGTEWANVPETKTTHYTIYKTTIEQTKKRGGLLDLLGLAGANGTAHAQGTAYKGGSWGAEKTETALTGELGPELRVRGNRWELLGENGAEFNEVKKGDIIFNHKQTEQLLTNGYITGRGKAFAEGTVGGTAYSGLLDPVSPNASLSNTAGTELGAAAGKLSEAADEIRDVFDWIEVRLEEINERLSLEGAKLENAIGSSKQNAIIDDMIDLNQNLYKNLLAGADKYYAYAAKLLEKVPAEYRKAAQDGSIAIEEFAGDAGKETLEAIQNYREWVQKGADATQQAEETLTEIQNLAKQAIDNITQEYENKASIPQAMIEQLEAYNALIETTQGAESAKIYEAMIKENNKQIATLTEQRKKMQEELNTQVELGNIQKYSQAWYDAIGEIAAVDTEIINLATDTEDYQDAINELHWQHLDNLLGRFEAISDEAEHLIDILGEKDLVNKDTGDWTNEGIASLGLYAQQMEVAEMQSQKYAEEISYLNENWKELGYTEQEYVEKLEELKKGQYDSIKAYNSTKKAIVDLTKERVDAIKNGIDKEIDAYEELISKKKEELNSEKDLYDFQKNVAKQQKDIATIERKLAALSSDNSASARAQRARLEAELAEARQNLADTYYDRSVSQKQEALDKELETFRDEKDAEKEAWDEYLEDTEKVVSDSLAVVQSNTEAVYNTLQDMGYEYSLSIADALTSPWKQGEGAIQSYSEKFGLSMSATIQELREVASEYSKVMSDIEKSGSANVNTVNDNMDTYQDAEYTKPTAQQPASTPEQQENITLPTKGSKVTVKTGTTHWSAKSGNKQMADFVPGKTYTVSNIYGTGSSAQILLSKKDQNKKSATYGKTVYMGWVNLKDLEGYASGTTGVQSSQFALLDELGEELVIRPSNGRMTFMEKGTGVVPADLTANLMEWGELDPSIMLERNKPVISAPHVTNNNIEIHMEFGEVVHIDTVTNDTIPNLTKAIEKQMDKYMKNVNNNIRKYTR